MRYIGNVEKDAQVRAVASGALSNGDTVVVNSDGTVSAVAGSSASAGTKATFESASSNHLGAVYDPNTDKVVVFYRDLGNSYYGTAAVGTISGTSISFGTPVVFYSNNSQYSNPVYDANSTKIVNYFSRDPDNYGMAIVGTVSGTSISFGTAAIYATAQVRTLGAAYASNTNTSVVLYRDEDTSNTAKAVAGTVSGTSISFGSITTAYSSSTTSDGALVAGQNATGDVRLLGLFNTSSETRCVVLSTSGTSVSASGTTQVNSATSNSTSAAYDSNASKFLIAYSDSGSSYLVNSKVASISGTTVSLGSEVNVSSDTNAYGLSTAFNSTGNKVTVAYRSSSASNYLKFVDGAVSGTSVTYDTPYATSYGADDEPVLVYDDAADKFAAFFKNITTSYGEAVVYTSGSTNLTAENFIGFAAHSYADTQSAVINTTCSVDRNQAGLTAGQKYYVQTDGSLGLTAADPSVEAGTAISSTEILVKG